LAEPLHHELSVPPGGEPLSWDQARKSQAATARIYINGGLVMLAELQSRHSAECSGWPAGFWSLGGAPRGMPLNSTLPLDFQLGRSGQVWGTLSKGLGSGCRKGSTGGALVAGAQ